MKEVDGARELIITSQRTENEQLMVSVSDTGVGLPEQQADQIFDPSFITKPHGTGMGLRISRSIVESRGGRLWAADKSPRGVSLLFHFTHPKPRPMNDARWRSNSVRPWFRAICSGLSVHWPY
jgi:signal transduction histidine kinase